MEDNKFEISETVTSMTLKNFVWGFVGILLGMLTNVTSNTIFLNTRTQNKHMKIIIQLLLCSIVLAFVHVKINNKFGWTWQNVTPGLFFVSFFFGCQYLIFSTIQNTYM